jgi:hypothetical protein
MGVMVEEIIVLIVFLAVIYIKFFYNNWGKQNNLNEMDTVQCNGDNTKTYAYTGGQLRWYPNIQSVVSWKPDVFNDIKHVDCTKAPIGAPLDVRPADPNWGTNNNLSEWDTVKCNGDDGTAYAYVGNQLRIYPSSEIALSWNPNVWSNVKKVNCPGASFGTPLTMKNA